MAAITDVTLTAGVPTAGTGTVTTLDKFDGAAGTPTARAVTIQGNSGGTAVPVSVATIPSHAVTNAGTFAVQESGAALTALQLIDDTVTAQGTALGTTKTTLAGGSVTTAAPTYTTGQISPLNLDTAGNLRVNVAAGGGSGGTSSTFGAAVPGTGTAAGFSDGTNMVMGRVKPASTAPLATDPAIVVAISPNSVNANGQTTMANSSSVAITSDQTTLPAGGNVAHDAVDAGNPLKIGGFAKAAAPTDVSADSDRVNAWFLRNGALATVTTAGGALIGGDAANGMDVDVTRLPALVAGSATIGQVGLVPVTSGGYTINSYLIAAGTNATSVKGSAGQIYKIEIFNNSANIGYLKVYNTAGTPTAGSGTPVIRMMCPGSASGAGAVSSYENGVAMGTGIGFTFTGGIADADTTSVAASAFIVNVYSK